MNPREHEFEAAPGLPEPLPPGERILWQGSPDWRVLAREALHWRKLAIYFGVLLLWRAVTVWHDGEGMLTAMQAAVVLVPLPAIAIGIALALAWLSARTSLYTVTDRRIVMRVGIVLSLSFNLPFRQIAAADLRRGRDGRGDIALSLAAGNRIGYLQLWPHARPWRLTRTQPMLRALPDVDRVAALLTQALSSPGPAALARAA